MRLGGRIARRDRKRNERLGNASDNVFAYKKHHWTLFRGHQSVSGVRRSIGRAGLTAETGKGLSGLEIAGITCSRIKNVIGPCFGVTSPFREVGGQSGPTAGRRPAV